MSQKRQQEDGKARSEGSTSDDKRRKRPSFRNAVLEVMRSRKIQLYMELVLEPLIRRVVKEEVELALRKNLISMKQNCGKEIPISESRLQLEFLSKISPPVFTGTPIEGEECNTIKVALVDTLTGHVICSGPESSAKVEIVVLEGDFDSDEGGSWTLEEFKDNIAREREGKKPLLSGDALVNLMKGIGLVGNISFTDNSSWTRSRKFRLGARVVDNFDGIRVKEAMTETFVVRDHRGESYKKHHPPSLQDEVWRLEKIGKDGAFHKRLRVGNVNSVKDFLTLLSLDPDKLRNILGSGVSAKMWEVTADHARTCLLDPNLHVYFPGSAQKTGVVFNVVGHVMGLFSDCQYSPVDKLSETKKAEAHNLVIGAYKNWEDVVSFDDEASFMDYYSHLRNNALYSNSALVETSVGSEILNHQIISGFNPQQCGHSPDTSPPIYFTGDVNSLDDFCFQTIDNMDLRYDQPSNFPGQIVNSLISETESNAEVFCDEECLTYFNADSPLQSQKTSLVSPAELHSSAGFAQRKWTMVFSVLKWFSIKRVVAKRNLDREKQRYL